MAKAASTGTVALAGAWALRVPDIKRVTLIFALILASVLINPGLSVARYVPQLWLAVVMLLLLQRPRAIVAAAGAALALNVLLVGVVHLRSQVVVSRVLRSNLRYAARLSQREPLAVRFDDGFQSNRERLRYANVKFVERAELPCTKPESLTWSQTKICIP